MSDALTPKASSVRLHWLTAVIAQAGLLRNMSAREAASAVPAELQANAAWDTACEAFGLSQDHIASIVARAYHLEAANTTFLQHEVRAFLPEELARTLGVVPVRHTDTTLVVATCDPLDPDIEGRVAALSGRPTTLAVAGPASILLAQDLLYGKDSEAATFLASLKLNTAMDQVELPAAAQSLKSRAAPVERILRLVLYEAVKSGAQEVHLEPQARGGKVAFTVDGERRTFIHIPVTVLLRVMASLRAWRDSTGTGPLVTQIDGHRHELIVHTKGPEAADPISIFVDPLPPKFPRADPAMAHLEPGTGEALVVDDDPEARLLLGSVLEQHGFRVTEAADGVEALDALRREEFDIMLLDLSLPRMSGLQVLERVRGTVRTSALPVIIVTASTNPDDKRLLMSAGASDYLQKPIDPPRVAERVLALLRRSLSVI